MLAELEVLPKPIKSDDPKVSKIMQNYFGKEEWPNKCERTLLLSKNLGNIYTGSLYNGLMSLLESGISKEEGSDGINLNGKQVLMFSYGSGCASSMFIIKIKEQYQNAIRPSMFKKRLESRVKLSPEEFDRWMT